MSPQPGCARGLPLAWKSPQPGCARVSPSARSEQDAELARAVRVLREGGVVAHASEGVWGLACDPFNRVAVQRVLAIKGRAAAKGLIVVAGNHTGFAEELEALDPAVAARVRASWPGAVTWLVANQRFPAWITGGRNTVAIRVPGHDQARALAMGFGGPLVSTSANRAGETPAATGGEVSRALGGEIDYLLPGAIGDRQGPSHIVDAASGARLR